MSQSSNFWQWGQLSPDAIALIDEDEQIWTAGELLAESNRIANGLRTLGLRKGDVIAVLMPTCGHILATVLATYQVGMYSILLNPRLSEDELLYILNDADAKLLIIHDTFAILQKVSAILSREPQINVCMRPLVGCLDYPNVFGAASADTPLERSAGSILGYTSGTTGRPKGVLREIGDRQPEAVLAPLVQWFTESFQIARDEPNIQLNACPLYFSGPILFALYALHLGHTLVLMKFWNPRVALHLIEKYEVTTAFMVPFHFQTLLRLPEPERRFRKIGSVRRIIHSGAPCPRETKKAMLDWFGECLYETYGATEIGTTQCSSQEWLRHPGTVGRAVAPHEVRILDANDREVPLGTIGRVFLREGAFGRFEYKGDPVRTAACHVGDFVTVGDLGHLNDEGYLFLSDRRDDLILCRGENVYPAEVESALATHEHVLDCGCFGLPHPDWGQQVAIAVLWLDESIDETGRRESVILHLTSRLSPVKIPIRIQFVKNIPRDASGKLRRAELATQALASSLRQES